MLSIVKKRRSVRSFLSKAVEDEKIEEVLKAASFSPSANHLKPWQFIIVRDAEVKKKLSLASPWGYFVAKSSVVIVVCADESISCEWIEDCSVVGAHIYLEVVNQGLGTCWVQIRGAKTIGGENAEDYVKKLLDIPRGFRVLSLFPIGYPGKIPPSHSGAELEREKIHSGKW